MSTSGMNALSASNRATVAVRTERFAWTVSTFRRLKASDSASRMGRPGAGAHGRRQGLPSDLLGTRLLGQSRRQALGRGRLNHATG